MFARRDKPSLFERLRNFVFPRRGLKRGYLYIWHRAKRIGASPHAIALGFAFGAFVSFTPFVGFHFILAGILAWLFGGSIIASALGTAVGNPLTFPFIWWSAYNLGGLMLGYAHKGEIHIQMPHGLLWMLFADPAGFGRAVWGILEPVFVPMLVGGIPIGAVAGAFFYLLVRRAVERYQAQKRTRLARRITRREAAE